MKSRLLRAGISLALIVVLFSIIDIQDLLRSIAGFHPISGLIALALLSLQNVLSARRWGVMLRAFGAKFRHLAVLRIQYAALFAQLFLPPAIGGAAVRTAMSYRAGIPLGVCVNSVVFDRLVAMTGLVLLGILFMPFVAVSIVAPEALPKAAGIAIASFGAALLIGWVLVAWHPLRRLWKKLYATPLKRSMDTLRTGMVNLRQPGISLSALAYSISGQIAAIAAVFSLAKGAGIQVGFIDCLLIMPPVMFVSALPVSVAGWGVREGAMVVAFGLLGVSREAALALSIQAALAGYLAATPGALVWLIEMNRRSGVEEKRSDSESSSG